MDSIERSILDAKARYWAAKIKEPDFSYASLTSNPGSEISNPRLRTRFYDLMKAWHRLEFTPKLNPLELKSLTEAEEKILRIMKECNS